MTKQLLACAAMFSFTAALALAQTPPPAAAPSYTITASASVVSNYMWRGLRLSGAAFQPAVEFGVGNFVAGVWGSTPFEPQKVPDSSDPEFDIYGAYTFTVNDSLTIVPGFTSYNFPKAPTNAGFYRSSFEPSLALNYTVQGLKITPKIYYDVVTEGATYELNAFYAIPLKDLGSELDFTAQVGTYKWTEFANDASPSVKAWGDYWFAGVSMPFQFSANSKVTIGMGYTEGREAFVKQGTFPRSANSGAVGRGVASITYAFTF